MPDINVSLDKDLHDKLNNRIKELEISKSKGIKNALKVYLSEEKENSALLLEKKDNEIQFLKDQLEKKDTELKTKTKTLKARIRNKNKEIKELEEKIENHKNTIEKKEEIIKNKEKIIDKKNNRINKLEDRNSELINDLNKCVLSKEDIKGINKLSWITIKILLKTMGKK